MKETRIMQSDEIQVSTNTYKINKTLKLNSVTEGEPTDNVLVHGVNNEVKSVSRSEFGGGSQNLQQVFDTTVNVAEGLYTSPSTQNNAGMYISAKDDSSIVKFESKFGNHKAIFGALNGKVLLSQMLDTDFEGEAGTTLLFEDPFAKGDQSEILIPAKSSGSYTLATKDDISLQKAIETDNSTNLPIKFVGDYGFSTLSVHGLTTAKDGSGFVLPRITDGEGQLDLLTSNGADSKYLQKALPLASSHQVYGIDTVGDISMFTVEDTLSSLTTSLPSSFAVKTHADTKLPINSDPVGYPRVYAARGNGTQTMYNVQTAPIITSAGNVNAVPNVQVVKDYVDANTRSYKIYVAKISQSGTAAPTAIIFENTLGGTIVWTRTGIGQYRGTLAGVITSTKTTAFFQFSNFQSPGQQWTSALSSTQDHVDLNVLNNGNLTDAVGGYIEIKVYP